MALAFGYVNDLDDPAIITSSSAVSTLPASNLKDKDIQKIWRATSNTNVQVYGDSGTTLTLGYAALFNTNARSGDTARVRASITHPQASSNLTYDSGTILMNVDVTRKRFIHILSTPVEYRYVRIDLFQADVPQAGRYTAGRLWFPSRHMSVSESPPSNPSRDFSRRSYSLSLNVFNDVRPRQYGFRFSLRGLSLEDKYEIDEMNRLAGTSNDVLIVWDTTNPNFGNNALWGQMEESPEPTIMDDTTSFWSAEFEAWNRL